MMTYTPVPFMDAKPVNDLIHKRPAFAYGFTVHQNKRSFRIGQAVNMFADLALPHKWDSAVTNFAINAAKLRNIFTYAPYPSPMPLHTPSCTFTYSPRAYRLGRVYNWVGGINIMVGGELHYVRGFRHEPGYYGWVGVMLSLYLSLTGGGMFSAYHRKLTNGRVLTQGVKVLSYKYIDVNKQCTPATNAIMVELHPPAISIHKGVEVYVCVEGEFKPIGTIH